LAKPPEAMLANGFGTTNLLQACIQNGVRKFVYASTWEVYGESRYEPIDEDHPCRLEHPYGVGKLAGEQMVAALAPTVWLASCLAEVGNGIRDRNAKELCVYVVRATCPKGTSVDLAWRWRSGSPIHTCPGRGASIRFCSRGRSRTVHSTLCQTRLSQLRNWRVRFLRSGLWRYAGRNDGRGTFRMRGFHRNGSRVELGWQAHVRFTEGLRELLTYLECGDGMITPPLELSAE
jgi:hypothetical protein